MFKNETGQSITFLVIDTLTNLPKTGDAANLTAYLSQNDGTLTALTDTSATEISSTNAPGLYRFDVSQAESNADKLTFTCVSSTSNVRAVYREIFTRQKKLQLLFEKAKLITVVTSTFTPTTTQFETDQTFGSGSPYTEQVLVGLDGSNAGVTVKITGYAFTNGKDKLTVDTLPVAPAAGYRFLLMGRIEQ